MGIHSILSVFGEELSEDVVRSNWPDRYADALQTIYDEENPGDGIYAYVESTYDREHDVFLPDVLRAIPGATLVVLTQMNNTTDSGSAWGYRKDGPEVEFLGTVRGAERVSVGTSSNTTRRSTASESGRCGRRSITASTARLMSSHSLRFDRVH